jgi:hypothetical protein
VTHSSVASCSPAVNSADHARLPTLLREQWDVRIAGQDGNGPQHQAYSLRVQAGIRVRAQEQLASEDACRDTLLIGQPVGHVAGSAIGRVHGVRCVVEPHPGEPGGPGVVLHLAQQPRLADPGLAADEHCPAASGLGRPAQQAREARLLVVATDQWGGAPAGMADDAVLVPKAVDCNRAAMPSQEVFADGLDADARFGCGGSRVVQQDLVRLGHLLEPRRRRHGIARQSQRPRPRHLPGSGHDLTGRYADP